MGSSVSRDNTNIPYWVPNIKKGKIIKFTDDNTVVLLVSKKGKKYKVQLRLSTRRRRRRNMSQAQVIRQVLSMEHLNSELLNRTVQVQNLKFDSNNNRLCAELIYQGHVIRPALKTKRLRSSQYMAHKREHDQRMKFGRQSSCINF